MAEKQSMADLAAEYLQLNSEELVSEWIDWLRNRIPTGTVSALPQSALRNHVPPVLESLADYVRSPQNLTRVNLLNHLKLHGQIRRDQGFSLQEVLAEFDGLAEIVTSRVTKHAFGSFGNEDVEEAVDLANRLASGLRSVGYIAMGTYDQSDEERSQSLSASLEEFARSVQHEMRSPLTTLRHGLELLRHRGDGEATLERHLITMEGALTRCATLLDSLMMLAIAERGRAGEHLVPMEAVFGRVVEALSGNAASREVSVTLEGEVPAVNVEGAFGDLVLANLIGNAIKYADPSKPERLVRVSAVLLEEERDSGFCEVRVSDNGLGIPEELLPRVFQKGFRAHADHALGTGMGLHIVQRLLHERGGAVSIDSELGEGTTVTARLRCLPDEPGSLASDRFRVENLMGDSAWSAETDLLDDTSHK